MLSDMALKAVSHTLTVGCFIKVLPYNWDSNKYQLSIPTKRMWLYHLHRFYILILGITIGIRFLIFIKVKDEPAQIRVLHLAWTFAYFLANICSVQFHRKRAEIMYFANLLFNHINKTRAENQCIFEEGKDKKCKDTISAFVLISTFLLFLNVPCHAVAIIQTPCSPNFVSSLYYACEDVMENKSGSLDIIPWIFAEGLVVTNFLFGWSFNWIMIFLGLAWIREELRKLSKKMTVKEMANSQELDRKYRELQCISVLINDSFRLYLQWFPTIFLGTVALLIFGSIRLWHIEFFTYINFPTCALRCLFELMTPLAISGDVNAESAEFLERRREINDGLIKSEDEGRDGYKSDSDNDSDSNPDFDSEWLVRFQASCSSIKCMAGSLYSFERAIVVTTVHNCAQLTLNLLLLYK